MTLGLQTAVRIWTTALKVETLDAENLGSTLSFSTHLAVWLWARQWTSCFICSKMKSYPLLCLSPSIWLSCNGSQEAQTRSSINFSSFHPSHPYWTASKKVKQWSKYHIHSNTYWFFYSLAKKKKKNKTRQQICNEFLPKAQYCPRICGRYKDSLNHRAWKEHWHAETDNRKDRHTETITG